MSKLPLDAIREMDLESLLAAMRNVPLNESQKQRIAREAFEILQTRELCHALGIDWLDPTYEQGKRADYAAFLMVTQQYAFS